MGRRGLRQDGPRRLDRGGDAHARSQARRSCARSRPPLGRLLCRCARQQAHPRQAQGPAARGRHHRRAVRAHPRPGRTQHRRQVAGRDRRVDPGPDHRGARTPTGRAGRAQGCRRVRFGETPIDEAAGAILAHSWRANGVNFAKGRVLSGDDVAKLKSAGVSTVVAARLDPDDIHEDEAAATLAKALAGEGIEVTAPFTGRCNHFAREAGVAVIDEQRVDALNELDESVTVATLPPYARVSPRQMVATVKIIPYAAPRAAVDRAIEVAKASNRPMISVAPFKAMKAGLVQTKLPGTRDKVLDKAVGTTTKRLTSLGSALVG